MQNDVFYNEGLLLSSYILAIFTMQFKATLSILETKVLIGNYFNAICYQIYQCNVGLIILTLALCWMGQVSNCGN